MRGTILLLGAAVCASLSFGQIPNGGFETWATDPDSNYNPVGWETSNSFPVVNVEPLAPGCSGSFALRVKTVNLGLPYPGVAILQTAHPFSQTPTKFSACVKSTIMPGDTAFLIVALMKGDSVIAATGNCTFKIDTTISQFTYMEFPIALQSTLVPDSLLVMVASGLSTGHEGTELVVDDLAFMAGGSTEVLGAEPLPGTFTLNQNYPNPFNPTTVIRFGIPHKSAVNITVYNTLGQRVAVLVDSEMEAGYHSVRFDAHDVAGGVYLYCIVAGDFRETKRLLLVK